MLELRQLRQLEEENQQLKQLVAEWSATAAEFRQADASGCDQKKALTGPPVRVSS